MSENKIKKITNEPVVYKKSIMAAFDRQNRGKNCPVCKIQLTIAAYRQHLDQCKVSEDDEECTMIASYSKEEAILLRAGAEIVLDEEEKDENHPEQSEKNNISSLKDCDPVELEKLPQIEEEQQPKKRRKSEVNFEAKKVKTESRRRSTRIHAKEECTNTSRQEILDKIEIPTDNSLYYLKFTMMILKKILESDYDDQFWEMEDLLKMHRFVIDISKSSKLLLIRLVLRKHGWYHAEKLKQKYTEVQDFEMAVNDLIRWKFVEDDSMLKSLDDALSLADLHILKNVAKKFKIDPNRGRLELVRSVKSFANSQKSIFGTAGNIGSAILRTLKKELGTCIRLNEDVLHLFQAIFTLFCPTTTNSAQLIENPKTNIYQDLLYILLQIDTGSVTFPATGKNPKIAGFYENRNMLMRYISAKNLETQILSKMNNSTTFEAAFELALLAKDQIDDKPHESLLKLPIYQRKFTDVWVLTRCCSHGATVLEKMRRYGMAVEWQKYLLLTEDLKEFCVDSRGVWWDRLLLNLDSHLKEKTECLKYIEMAMNDPNVLEKELLMIQDRAIRINKEFEARIVLNEPVKTCIKSRVLSKELGDGRVNRFVIRNAENDEVECSVEEVSRLYYLENEGFTCGVHDEGAIWHTIFGILFYDVIFNIQEFSDTWISECQDSPIDLSNTLYTRRRHAFDARFEWLKNAENCEIEDVIQKVWTENCAITNRECSWKLLDSPENAIEFWNCLPREGVIEVFKRLAGNYRNCRSGFPDLTMWNASEKRVAVVEVKGPGDRLSTKQRLWLESFQKFGIRAEVCYVSAETEKSL